MDHHTSYQPSFEDIITSYLCQLYQLGDKANHSHHLTQNIFYFLHGMKLRNMQLTASPDILIILKKTHIVGIDNVCFD